MSTKGYAVWNYWDHTVVLLTERHALAETYLSEARKLNPTIEASWFGIEAIDDIGAVPSHLVWLTA